MDPNPRPRVLRRLLAPAPYEPFDPLLDDHVAFSPLFEPIDIQTLEDHNAIYNNLHRKYVDLQLVRVVPANTANVTNRRRRNTRDQRNFTRLFLCRVVTEGTGANENDRLVYLMETRTTNRHLWHMNLSYRDNGVISIGACIRILSPQPIQSYLNQDIPLLVSNYPAVALKLPDIFRSVRMDDQIRRNNSKAFVYNNVALQVNFMNIVGTTCSGYCCSRQRINDWNNVRGCGCYSMHPNASNLAIQFHISFEDESGRVFSMENFSCNHFTRLFLTSLFPGSVQLHMVQLTEHNFAIMDCVQRAVRLVLLWDFIGWYKRGGITDRVLLEADANVPANGNNLNAPLADAQADAGEISYHFTTIVPSNRDFMDPNTPAGRRLERIKFDVTQIIARENPVIAPDNRSLGTQEESDDENQDENGDDDSSIGRVNDASDEDDDENVNNVDNGNREDEDSDAESNAIVYV